MSISKARKMRQKMIQEGRLNPDIHRGNWNGVNPIEKKTPSLTEKKRKIARKHKNKWGDSSNVKDENLAFLIL